VFSRRVTIIVGHFGSGKTEIAINGALHLAQGGTPVALVDLDVVKPYFRSRSARALMADKGVTVVAPEGENLFADLPIIVPQIRTLVRDPGRKVVMDVGGDDTGARVLGSLRDVVVVGETDTLLVLNFRRPFTEDVKAAVTMVEEIEAAGRLTVTGLISNTHLMGETTPEVVTEGLDLAEETGRRLGVPVVAVTVDERVLPLLDAAPGGCPVYTISRLLRPPFEAGAAQRTTGPLFVLN
jgi:hypothetical protein